MSTVNTQAAITDITADIADKSRQPAGISRNKTRQEC